jgi:hypothetical protein
MFERITLSLPKQFKLYLQALSANTGVSQSETIRSYIFNDVKKQCPYFTVGLFRTCSFFKPENEWKERCVKIKDNLRACFFDQSNK